VQVKLWDPLRTHAIPERLRGAFTTRRYTNPRLPLPLPLPTNYCETETETETKKWSRDHAVLETLTSLGICMTSGKQWQSTAGWW